MQTGTIFVVPSWDGMTLRTGVIDVIRVAPDPPVYSASPPTMNETTADPPSYLQVQVGGLRLTFEHERFGFKTMLLN